MDQVTITPDWLQWGFGGILLLVLVGAFLLAKGILTKTIEQATKENDRREAREQRMQVFLESMVASASKQAADQTAAWREMSQESIRAQQATVAAQREQIVALQEVSETLRENHAQVMQKLIEIHVKGG